ncbi:MAG: 3'-5' exonuclease [Gemmatimonadota bacterium]
MTSPAQHDLELAAAALRASGEYRVLERFRPPSRYVDDDGCVKNVALAIDVETTGLDPQRDAIIQLCAIPFQYCPQTGRVFAIEAPTMFFEDPGRPIPPEIVALTGITQAMVSGKRIDESAVAALAATASLVIAHNAAFDRRFVERRCPVFRDKPWACTQQELPWRQSGYASAGLESLMDKRFDLFYAAHSAEADCLALIHLLARALPNGDLPLFLLLQSARRRSVRVWAVDAPFDQKGALKARKYRWNPGEDGRPKAWYSDIPEERLVAECAWLKESVYGGRDNAWKTQPIDAKSRYSERG